MSPVADAGCRPVVVGVDGSSASRNAAQWAVAEALQRDVPLRLVHVVPDEIPSNGLTTDPVLLTIGHAIAAAGKHVVLEVRRTTGQPSEVLIAESCHAELVCIGQSTPPDGKLFGPIAVALMEHARCPVAVIRTDRGGTPCGNGVVSVVLNDDPDNDAVVHRAMQEGRLRNATVRQIDRRSNSWIRRFPDVPVEVVAAGTGRRYRHSTEDGVQLAVVGDADADEIGTLAVPNCHPILGYPDCSVLMLRS